MMMKSKNQVDLSEDGAPLVAHAFLGGFFGSGNLVYYHPKGPLINLQNVLAKKLMAIYAAYLQPVFFNQLEYQPVWVK